MHWKRLALAGVVVAVVSGIDLSWKATALVAGHGWLDAPTSFLRPSATLLIGLLALTGVLLVPWLCLPGVLLIVGGVSSNVASLVLWRAVPNPLGVQLAGGVLRFNLADLCIYGGGLIFLAGTYLTLWRMPSDRFA